MSLQILFIYPKIYIILFIESFFFNELIIDRENNTPEKY